MTDLSLPTLSSVADATDADEPFKWPTPPFAAYAAPVRFDQPQACEIEGLNGSTMRGKLMAFVPAQGLLHVQVPPNRGALPLRFSQFRRLALCEPLNATSTAAAVDPHASILEHRPEVDFRLELPGGASVEGRTVGHVETAFGLFLFPPADEAGAVGRLFVPRDAYVAAEFGPPLANVLVEFQITSSDAVELAVEEQARLRNQKLGDILVTRHIVTPEQLLQAIEQQARMPMVRIGEALAALGLVTASQLEAALEQQKADRSIPLGELLVRNGIVTRQDLQTALARKMGYPVVDVGHFPIEMEAVRKLPFAVASRLNTLPLLLRGHRLIVAVEDPSRRAAIEELEFVSQAKVVPVLATATQLSRALPSIYEKFGADVWTPRGVTIDSEGQIEFDADDASKLVESLEHSSHERDDEDPQLEQSDNSLVRLINTMIVDAAGQGVSDIHVETRPGREKLLIRFRKDGLLKPYLELPHTYRSALVARIKIMCDLDISERRKPQDGKINFARFVAGQKLELRVATIPTSNGLEDVVMRLLTSAKLLPLDKLGFSAANLERLKTAVERPYGMVLCVGPTGSGKTTTLHSSLAHINTAERKIWTAEDPIEITQHGLRQVQVNPKIDWTFAKALRSFLRADPDVIMVGEIRDEETAQTAIEASLTGHLVLSTLHTNSAAETVTRLLDMGTDPFNFGDSLLAVLAQRLVRRLCQQCRTARDATDTEVGEWLDDWLHAFPDAARRPSRDAVLAEWTAAWGRDRRLQRFEAHGCAKCDGSGHQGRLALHELLVVSRELRRLIQTGGRVEELLLAALDAGMHTLRQDGIEKVLQGLTSIEEVRSTSNH